MYTCIDEEPLKIFLSQPQGGPELVTPDFNRKGQQPTMLEAVKQNITKLRPFLKDEEVGWWEEFLQDPDKVHQPNDWYLNVLPKCRVPDQNMCEQPANMESPLATVMQSERTMPQVSYSLLHCKNFLGAVDAHVYT